MGVGFGYVYLPAISSHKSREHGGLGPVSDACRVHPMRFLPKNVPVLLFTNYAMFYNGEFGQ